MKYNNLYLIFLSLLLLNCKKRDQPISWNADLAIPIAYGSLNISNLLSDSLTNTLNDQSVQLSYSNTLYSLKLVFLISFLSIERYS